MQKAKIFKNGQSEAVRLPKGFRFNTDEVFIHKVGNTVVLIPKEDAWQNLKEGLAEFSSDFMDERNQPQPLQKRAKL